MQLGPVEAGRLLVGDLIDAGAGSPLAVHDIGRDGLMVTLFVGDKAAKRENWRKMNVSPRTKFNRLGRVRVTQ